MNIEEGSRIRWGLYLDGKVTHIEGNGKFAEYFIEWDDGSEELYLYSELLKAYDKRELIII